MSEPLHHPHRPVLQEEMERVREMVLELGRRVDAAIGRATRGLVERDVEMCARVIAEDHLVDALHLLLEHRPVRMMQRLAHPKRPVM